LKAQAERNTKTDKIYPDIHQMSRHLPIKSRLRYRANAAAAR
jgi:hypothetical protein